MDAELREEESVGLWGVRLWVVHVGEALAHCRDVVSPEEAEDSVHAACDGLHQRGWLSPEMLQRLESQGRHDLHVDTQPRSCP